ncbi:MAG: type II secretion system protein [Idiomarina sp.]|nr:type II secretion system protein [Idiomarina sp.]
MFAPTKARSSQTGFTLIELIIVVVLLGIVSIGIFAYLGLGAQIFTDVVGREQLSSQSRFGVERLTRELRNALPGSPRVFANGDCIEFVPIRASGIYLQPPDPARPLPISIPENVNDIAGSPIPPADLEGMFLFIGANNQSRVYTPDSSTRARIEPTSVSLSADGNYYEIDFAGSADFSRQSPARRYYLTASPVSWCIDRRGEANNHSLVRYTGYSQFSSNTEPSIAELNALPPAQRSVIAEQIANSAPVAGVNPEPAFQATQAALTRNNLILIDLYFARRNGQEPLILHHEVHLPNVP